MSKEVEKYDINNGLYWIWKVNNRYHLPYVNTRNNIKIKTIFVRQINEN